MLLLAPECVGCCVTPAAVPGARTCMFALLQIRLGRHCARALQGVFRGLGDTRSPLWATILCNGVNVVLDALFIMYFGWGVAGAAWATIIGQVGFATDALLSCAQGVWKSCTGLTSTRSRAAPFAVAVPAS